MLARLHRNLMQSQDSVFKIELVEKNCRILPKRLKAGMRSHGILFQGSSELRLSEKQLSKEASRLGISPEELAIKRETAIGFYNNTEKFNGKSKRIESHLNGIDFSGPVEVTKIPRGTVVESWSIPGEKLGDYVALERTSPGSLEQIPLAWAKMGCFIPRFQRNILQQKTCLHLNQRPQIYSIRGLGRNKILRRFRIRFLKIGP